MPEVGGDLAQMQKLGKDLERASQSIDELQRRMTTVIQSTTWRGTAADKFRQVWSGEFSPSLKKMNTAFQAARREVDKRREALDAATRG